MSSAINSLLAWYEPIYSFSYNDTKRMLSPHSTIPPPRFRHTNTILTALHHTPICSHHSRSGRPPQPCTASLRAMAPSPSTSRSDSLVFISINSEDPTCCPVSERMYQGQSFLVMISIMSSLLLTCAHFQGAVRLLLKDALRVFVCMNEKIVKLLGLFCCSVFLTNLKNFIPPF